MALTGVEFCECSELYNILNQSTVYPKVSDPNYLLLLDVRKRKEFDESHIATARFVSKDDTGGFVIPYDAEVETKINIVVYDGNTSSLKDKGSIARACAKLLWEMGSKNPIKILRGGYEEFSALFPFLRSQEYFFKNNELDEMELYPVEVLPGFLYVGNWKQSQSSTVKKHLKVKAHVNVTMGTDQIFSPDEVVLTGKRLMHIPVEDDNSADLLSYFEEACKFIDGHQKGRDGRSVLIFSDLGISRSVTVAMAYLMWHRKCSLGDAYSHLKACKNNMQPYRSFIEQLSQWEEKLFEKIITDISEPGY